LPEGREKKKSRVPEEGESLPLFLKYSGNGGREGEGTGSIRHRLSVAGRGREEEDSRSFSVRTKGKGMNASPGEGEKKKRGFLPYDYLLILEEERKGGSAIIFNMTEGGEGEGAKCLALVLSDGTASYEKEEEGRVVVRHYSLIPLNHKCFTSLLVVRERERGGKAVKLFLVGGVFQNSPYGGKGEEEE